MSDRFPATHTNAAVIKPYSFLNTAMLLSIPAIDPQLSSSPRAHTSRSKSSEKDLERLVRITVEEDPWMKPHGKAAKAWKDILEQLQSEQRFESSSVADIQNKVNALIAWQEVILSRLYVHTH